MLYLEDIEKNSPRSIIKLQHNGSNFVIAGIIENDLDFSLGNSYDSNDLTTGGAVDGAISQATSAMGMDNFTMNTLLGTVSTWKGSQKPNISVTFTLTQYSPTRATDIYSKVKTLLALATPSTRDISELTSQATGSATASDNSLVSGAANGLNSLAQAVTSTAPGMSTLLTPPGGYQFDAFNAVRDTAGLKNFKGTWILEYSTWFRMDTLTLDSVAFSFSKELSKTTGLPLTAKISMSLTPAVQPTSDVVSGWIVM